MDHTKIMIFLGIKANACTGIPESTRYKYKTRLNDKVKGEIHLTNIYRLHLHFADTMPQAEDTAGNHKNKIPALIELMPLWDMQRMKKQTGKCRVCQIVINAVKTNKSEYWDNIWERG